MELKLVYRVLRKISDWTVGGFYSEVHVEGQENVPRDGPLIITSTHHNEIIDIATLAATIPHRRHLSFWAKSSMFANPLAGAILLSSGAIPVRRNPNHGSDSSSSMSNSVSSSILTMSTISISTSTDTSTPPSSGASTPSEVSVAPSPVNNNNSSSSIGTASRSSLFRESSHALGKGGGGVIGVFPEGTSYTQPGIVQVMSGAAWAAVDYVRSVREREGDGEANEKGEGKGKGKARELAIVPVAIVYTDKARYQSRVSVRYGTPILVAPYTEGIFEEGADEDAAARDAVKDIMAEVKRQMRAMSVNAPDWDTLYAAQMARDILWRDPANIPLKDWVVVSQTLVEIFTDPVPAPPSPTRTPNDALDRPALTAAKAALTKYYSLLHHTRIEHSTLTSLLPFSPLRSLHHPLRLLRALLSLLLFAPPMLVHIPGYISGSLAGRYLAAKGEEEAQAQFKAIFGGVGVGVGMGVLGQAVGRAEVIRRYFLGGGEGEEGVLGGMKRMVGLLGLVYASVWVLVKWHNALVCDNYQRLKTLLTLHKLCLGLLIPHARLRESELERYTRPPPPPPNPFIKRNKKGEDQDKDKEGVSQPRPSGPATLRPAGVASRKLIRPLLAARAEAYAALGVYLRGRGGDDGLVRLLRVKGARVDSFNPE